MFVVDVADVPVVVVPRDYDLGRCDPLEPANGLLVLPLVAAGGQVADDENDVRAHVVHAFDQRAHPVLVERAVAAVDVADLRQTQRKLGKRPLIFGF